MIEKETFNPVIKWTGSKRRISCEIVKRFPNKFDIYFEPFLGGGSITYQAKPKTAICGDICKPLIGFWNILQKYPEKILGYYRKNWKILQEKKHKHFNKIRSKFNETKDPLHLFFLSRTCVNGLVRFNRKGEFNNSFHHTRPGIHPNRIEPIIYEWSERIQNVKFRHGDYEEICSKAHSSDFVYLDPPYFNPINSRGQYYGSIEYDRFISFLRRLNEQNIRYALSLDGLSGVKDYKVDLPEELYEERFLLSSGKSTFKKVIDKEKSEVKESLYLNYSLD